MILFTLNQLLFTVNNNDFLIFWCWYKIDKKLTNYWINFKSIIILWIFWYSDRKYLEKCSEYSLKIWILFRVDRIRFEKKKLI